MLGFKNIGLIVAHDSKWGIGKGNKLPWNIKQDMEYFTKVTKNVPTSVQRNAVIMGKNTWKSIPKKYKGLDNRYNIVISRTMTQDELNSDNFTKTPSFLAKSLEDGIKMCKGFKDLNDIFIIGGSSLYNEAINKEYIHKMYINHIDYDYECDTFFPRFDLHPQDKKYTIEEVKFDGVIDKILNKEVKMSGTIETLKDNNHDEQNYLNLLQRVLSDGDYRDTRNAYTYSLFGPQLEFDLSDRFPLITTKRVFFKGIVEELLWFLRGDTNSNHLSDVGVKIWEPNTTREFLDSRKLAYEVGDIGPMYGFNWRHYGALYAGMNADYNGKGYDQLREVIKDLFNDQTSRRIMMTTYDPTKVSESVLAPCHGIITQFYVRNGHLDCKTYIRSSDTPVGLPYNIASYSLLVHIIAEIVGLKPGKLYITFGDTHIYECHKEAVLTQLKRDPYTFPRLKLKKRFDSSNKEDILDRSIKFIEQLEYEDIDLINYRYHPGIKMDMVA